LKLVNLSWTRGSRNSGGSWRADHGDTHLAFCSQIDLPEIHSQAIAYNFEVEIWQGTIFWGIFLALAGILKHIPEILKPEPYWSGPFSEGLIIGLIISGIVLAITSILALRNTQYAINDHHY